MFDGLVRQLQSAYPALEFIPGESFYWCPESAQVFYDRARTAEESACWSLLHETGHALLGHSTYEADLDLLHLEVSAWAHARLVAPAFEISIEDEYVQDCLDTYRDWLYRRSLCPGCGTQCLQLDKSSFYRCFNCHTRWHISPSRFCRAYRRAESKVGSEPMPVFALQHYK